MDCGALLPSCNVHLSMKQLIYKTEVIYKTVFYLIFLAKLCKMCLKAVAQREIRHGA